MMREEFVDYVASFNPKYVGHVAQGLIRQARKIQQREDESNKNKNGKRAIKD